MTPEAEQNAMLERLWRKHRRPGIRVYDVLAFGRELLQAVQERDAQIVNEWRAFIHLRKELVGQLKAQTYADLFMEEK